MAARGAIAPNTGFADTLATTARCGTGHRE
jgi:hypothetical protein